MDTWVWIVIAVVAAIVLLAVFLSATRTRRTRSLQDRFGNEYDRTVEQAGGKREAEQELRDREKRHDALDLRPLSPEQRDRYVQEWQATQGRFVDDPSGAVAEADRLVQRVMKDRGYPVDDFDQRAADISVEHPELVEKYRTAHGVAQKSERGQASTEELRHSVRHYRAVFAELLDTGDDVENVDDVSSRDESEVRRTRRRSRSATPLDQSAGARRVRPGIEPAAGTVRSLGDPHLLERRPVVRGALAPQQVGAVGALEGEVHLEPAVVGRVRVRPRPLEAVDAQPLQLVRRVLRLVPGARRDPLPRRELRTELGGCAGAAPAPACARPSCAASARSRGASGRSGAGARSGSAAASGPRSRPAAPPASSRRAGSPPRPGRLQVRRRTRMRVSVWNARKGIPWIAPSHELCRSRTAGCQRGRTVPARKS